MNITNIHNLPAPLVKAVTQQYNPNKGGYSVSELINPPQIVQLTRRHWLELEEDVSDRIWLLLGSATHYMLEKGEAPESLVEEKLEAKRYGALIRGRPDLWENSALHDYKITSVWSIIYEPQGRKDWETQLNLYKWLYAENGFPTDKLQIVAILRDWQKRQALKDSQYPQLPVIVIDIPIWSPDKLHSYLDERIQAHTMAKVLPDNQLPYCTDEEVWAKATRYAIMKEGRKKALGVYDTLELAKANLPTGNGVYIEERAGEKTRCMDYCPVSKFCSQYQADQAEQ